MLYGAVMCFYVSDATYKENASETIKMSYLWSRVLGGKGLGGSFSRVRAPAYGEAELCMRRGWMRLCVGEEIRPQPAHQEEAYGG